MITPCVNLAEMSKEKATIYFCLFDEYHFSNNWALSYVTRECIEINWMCEHRKKVISSQASVSINSCTELSNTVFPVSIVKMIKFWFDVICLTC